MIHEKHNFAIKYVTETEVELLENVVYESIMDVPFNGVGFTTKTARTKFMTKYGLTEYVPKDEHEYSLN